MSLLAPLYLLGALAVSLPVLLHLIRRTPRGRQPFSSLMFLTPSPPRITRRSRIEHWLLLLLRAAAVILLALAFCRPFLRETASLLLDTGPGQRLAIVVDTSASMQRGDLWRQAVARLERILSQLGPADEVGLFAYDDIVRTVVDWDEPLPDLPTRLARLRNGMKELSPGWGHSNLGQALVTVADRLAAARGDRRDDRPSHIVVLSDLQHGTDTSALQAFEWPAEVMLQTEVLTPASPDNAGVRLLEDEDTDEPGWRVRVANAAGSSSEQFRVSWAGGSSPAAASEEVRVYVPAGQSRVVRLNSPPASTDRLLLSGDAHPFDNTFYVSPIHQRSIRIAFAGQEMPDDPQGLPYFLQRVWVETPRRKVTLETLPPDQPFATLSPRQVPMVVVACPVSAEQLNSLRDYVRQGGTALLVVSDRATAESLVALTPGITHLTDGDSFGANGESLRNRPERAAGTDEEGQPGGEKGPVAKGSDYALLSDIDFRHPIFASFAGPRYNDFTKVRFWRHERFSLEDAAAARVLARFDDGDPAIWEQPLADGKLLWFACGWRPAESQLALSSKFVPMLSRVLDHLTGLETHRSSGWRVGRPLLISTTRAAADSASSNTPAGPGMLTKPDGSVVELSAEAGEFRDTDQPGIYRLQRGAALSEFAVNVDAAESDTAPLAADHLMQLGIRVGRQPTHEEQMAHQRQMRDTELESRQKLWQWLLMAVLGILGAETVLAGRLARREAAQPPPVEAEISPTA